MSNILCSHLISSRNGHPANMPCRNKQRKKKERHASLLDNFSLEFYPRELQAAQPPRARGSRNGAINTVVNSLACHRLAFYISSLHENCFYGWHGKEAITKNEKDHFRLSFATVPPSRYLFLSSYVYSLGPQASCFSYPYCYLPFFLLSQATPLLPRRLPGPGISANRPTDFAQ